MDFKALYHLAQQLIAQRTEAGKVVAIVPVVDLKNALVAGIPWISDINFHPIQTKEDDPLGHYECHSEAESRWDEPDSWVVLITYCSELSMCEQRFVWCKEMMHIFDTVEGSVKTPDEYRGLLREIELRPIEPSTAFLTENTAKWQALLVLCPKIQRDEMKNKVLTGAVTNYDVALHFRIPENIVPSLFSD
jgi:hypothetical protein